MKGKKKQFCVWGLSLIVLLSVFAQTVPVQADTIVIPDTSSVVNTFTADDDDDDWDIDLDVDEDTDLVEKVQALSATPNGLNIILSWREQSNATGYSIEKKAVTEPNYTEIAVVPSSGYVDSNITYNTQYIYRVRAVNNGVYGEYSDEVSQKIELGKTTLTFTRSGTKVKLSWKKIANVDGYQLYMCKKGQSNYKKVKTIADGNKLNFTKAKLDKNKEYKFYIRAYVNLNGQKSEGTRSDIITVDTVATSKLKSRINKLRKVFPDGKFWTHVGVSTKGKDISMIVTSKPCGHNVFGLSKTCNYYRCPNGVLGYQCYGFAWKLSDLIFGRNASIKTHHSFNKAKVGDVIRYSGHSVFIISKSGNSITVVEANFNRPCMIHWDRTINRSELKDAEYSTRY